MGLLNLPGAQQSAEGPEHEKRSDDSTHAQGGAYDDEVDALGATGTTD